MKFIFDLSLIFGLWFFISMVAISQATIQYGPDGFVKIEEGLSGFNAALDSGDRFSRDHDVAGDVNGDGILDIVVGARSDDDGQTDAGAVYILFMNRDGTVQSNQKISMLEGGFTGTLNEGSFFGYGVAGIGDYNNDDIPDIAVTASSAPTNSIFIIHLNRDGTVKDFVRNGNIDSQGLSAIGDLNGDGRTDLVACNSLSNQGGQQRGAIEILFFDESSQVMPEKTVAINSTQGGFGDGLQNNDRFGGREVALLGDLDNDGNKELAIGAFMSDGGKGAVWIVSLDSMTHQVISKLKITEGEGGFTDILTDGSNPNGTSGASFGHALCAPGDLNGDGIPDLITGANQQDEGWCYIIYLNADKTVKAFTKINNTAGGFGIELNPEERFSRSISCIGDLRGDGSIAVNIGGGAGGSGASGTGALYILTFKPCTIDQLPGNNRWANGNVFFSNWNHPTQMLTGPALTFEQCTSKAFEANAPYITYNFNDGRCITMDSTAISLESTELSTAFINECNSDLFTTALSDYSPQVITSIFPNPTHSSILLSIERTSFSPYDRVDLMTMAGQILSTSRLSQHQIELDLSQYPAGIYVVNVIVENKSETYKIIKN